MLVVERDPDAAVLGQAAPCCIEPIEERLTQRDDDIVAGVVIPARDHLRRRPNFLDLAAGLVDPEDVLDVGLRDSGDKGVVVVMAKS